MEISMDIVKIVDEYMGQNSYLLIEGAEALLVDAGVSVERIEENLKLFTPRPKLKAILLTHAHFDHIAALDAIMAKYGCPAYIFTSGKPMLYREDQNMSVLDIPFKIKTKKNIKTFKDGQELNFENIRVKCFNTPGHSNDSCCFVVGDNMFTGDTVFKVECGRYDLYSGDSNMLRISLERIKNVLSEDVEHFYAGHGPNFNKSEMEYNIGRLLGEMFSWN